MSKFKKDQASKENEIAYTEDGVPVYTLYLSNIPKSKNENDIKEYFSSFGNVESVKVVRKNQQNSERMFFQHGFVTFTEPEDATRALNSRYLEVKPADTWKQPKIALKALSNLESAKNGCEGVEGDDTLENNAVISLLHLNDDCLRHICSFLSQHEVFKLSFVCKRFYNMIEHIIMASKFIDLNAICTNFTLMETRQILSAFGEHIRRLRLRCEHANYNWRRFIELVPKFCHNLEEIEFDFLRDIHLDTYKRIFQSSKHLKSLTLRNCALADGFCSLISECPELESLDLSNNEDITGKHLKLFKSLKRLNIRNCRNIDSADFVELCQAVKLKELNVAECYQLGDEALNALVATQTDLDWLGISNSISACRIEVIEKINSLKHVRIHGKDASVYSSEVSCKLPAQRQESLETLELYNLSITEEEVNCERILQLKNLKKLCIVRDQKLTDVFLGKIARNCRMLESLNIAASSHLVTDSGVLDVVENLQNLKFLNISFCYQFDYPIIHGICSVLENRKNKMKQPLTLCVADMNFEVFQLTEDPKIRKLITLSFEKDSLSANYYNHALVRCFSDENVYSDYNPYPIYKPFGYDSDDSSDEPEPFFLLR